MFALRLTTSPILLFVVSSVSPLIAQQIEFEKVVLDPRVGKVCYAVTAADVDGDGKLDPVAISEREAVWFKNPSWKKHLMIADAVPLDHVCIAPADIDGDGKIDFALGAGWPRNGGTIHWLQRSESLDQPWRVHRIGDEDWTHRMRFADVLGRGSDQLVVTPLNATVGDGIRLLAFPIPDNPAKDRWQPIVVNDELNRAHNHWHLSTVENPKAQSTLVASQEGITLIEPQSEGFTTQRISRGARGEQANQQGSGEVKTGTFGDRKMLGAIEPMHGNQVVVYLGDQIGPEMKRIVLDESFVQGHAVWCADFDGDGRDEVVAAHREPTAAGDAPGIYLYRADNPAGTEWSRQTIDSPMACEDVYCGDFNGDGTIDILAGGRATHDVNLYLGQVK